MNAASQIFNPNLKKLSPAQLQEIIQKAQARLADTRDEQIVKFRAKVVGEMKSNGFTFDEIFGGNHARRLMKAKFANPANPAQTWSGHGKRPRWFVDATSAGMDEESLLLENVLRKDRSLN